MQTFEIFRQLKKRSKFAVMSASYCDFVRLICELSMGRGFINTDNFEANQALRDGLVIGFTGYNEDKIIYPVAGSQLLEERSQRYGIPDLNASGDRNTISTLSLPGIVYGTKFLGPFDSRACYYDTNESKRGIIGQERKNWIDEMNRACNLDAVELKWGAYRANEAIIYQLYGQSPFTPNPMNQQNCYGNAWKFDRTDPKLEYGNLLSNTMSLTSSIYLYQIEQYRRAALNSAGANDLTNFNNWSSFDSYEPLKSNAPCAPEEVPDIRSVSSFPSLPTPQAQDTNLESQCSNGEKSPDVQDADLNSSSSPPSSPPSSPDSFRTGKFPPCGFCRTNNESEEFCKTHPIRWNDKVTCPNLRKYVCRFCGATGRTAHTIKYCPKNPKGVAAKQVNNLVTLIDNEVQKNFQEINNEGLPDAETGEITDSFEREIEFDELMTTRKKRANKMKTKRTTGNFN